MILRVFKDVNSLLAIAVSVFAVVGITLSQYLSKFPIVIWGLCLVGGVIVATILLLTRPRAPHSFGACCQTSDAELSKGAAAAFMRFQPYGLLIVAILAVVLSVRMQISIHGYVHSAYVFQILNGIVPPENPTLPGHPANSYWPYHALIASLVNFVNAPPPMISAYLNIALLILTIVIVRQILRMLYFSSRPEFATFELLALFVLFGANSFGLIHAFIKGSCSTSYLMSYIVRPEVLTGSTRLTNLLEKYVNFAGFPLGVFLFAYSLSRALKSLNDGLRQTDVMVFILIAYGALALHATSGIFLLLTIPPAFACTWFLRRSRTWRPGNLDISGMLPTGSDRQRLSPGILGILGFAVLAGIPLLTFLLNVSTALPTQTELRLLNRFGIESVFSAAYPIAPFFGFGLLYAWRERDFRLIFLGTTALSGLMLTTFVALPDGNEYKFVYLAMIPFCLVSVASILRFLRGAKNLGTKIGRSCAFAILILISLNLLFVGLSRVHHVWFGDRRFQYVDSHVELSRRFFNVARGDYQYHDLFTWIRENTDPNTVVVTVLMPRDKSTLYLLSERLPFVVERNLYNDGLDALDERINWVTTLYSNSTGQEEKVRALDAIRRSLTDRPMVFIYPHSLRQVFEPEVSGLRKLMDGRQASLYQLVYQAWPAKEGRS